MPSASPDFFPPMGGDPYLPPLPSDAMGFGVPPGAEGEWWEAGGSFGPPVPQPEWPGLMPALGEDPLNPPPPGSRPDPRRPGFMERPGLPRMGVETHHALLSQEISDTEMREWSIRPWMAFPFLSTRMSPSPGLAALEQWYAAASQAGDPRAGDMFAQQWAMSFPAEAEAARNAVSALSRGLRDTTNVRARTNEHLRDMRERGGINWLESSFRKTKEFVWDEFRDHPLTSVAVVASMFILYKMMKGKNIGKYVALGIGGTVLYTFLKDRYNFQPGETIARMAEGVGGRRAGDAVRNFRDTLRRPFTGPEGEGSAIGFLQEQIGINDAGERIVFQAMTRQNPRDFLAWYEQARLWQYSGPPAGIRLPGTLEQELRSTNTPTWFKQLSQERKAEMVLAVADKMFRHIGRNAEGMDPVAYIQSRYIEGTFFGDVYGEWREDIANAPPGSPLAMMAAQDPTMRGIMGGMQHRTRNGSRAMDFLDILMMEMDERDWNGVRNYNGAGWDAAEVAGGLRTGATRSFEFAQDWIARPLINLFTTHLPNFWNNTLSPLMSRNGITLENLQTQFMRLYEGARATGARALTVAAGSPLWHVLRDAGLLAWDGTTNAWTMSMEQADRFSMYMQWKRIETRAMALNFPVWRSDVLNSGTGNLNGTIAGDSMSFVHTADVPQREQMWNLLRESGAISASPTIERNVPAPGNIRVTIPLAEAARLRSWVMVASESIAPPPAIDAADRTYVTMQLGPALSALAPPLTVEIHPGPIVKFFDPARSVPAPHVAVSPLALIRALPGGPANQAAALLVKYNTWMSLPPATRRVQPNPLS